MGMSAFLRTTVFGLLMLMAGFATVGFFSGWLAVLTASGFLLGGIGVVLWGKRQ